MATGFSQIVVKVSSVPTNFKQDAMRVANVKWEDVTYVHSTCIEPKEIKNFFTEPREYTVTLGLRVTA